MAYEWIIYLVLSAAKRDAKRVEYLHHAFTAWVAVLNEYKILQKDPRFKDFMARLNLPE